jgi:hypothetical protein
MALQQKPRFRRYPRFRGRQIGHFGQISASVEPAPWLCYVGRMNTDDVLDEFRAAGALREGHFVLSSGLHSPVFLQKNLVFMNADR